MCGILEKRQNLDRLIRRAPMVLVAQSTVRSAQVLFVLVAVNRTWRVGATLRDCHRQPGSKKSAGSRTKFVLQQNEGGDGKNAVGRDTILARIT